MVEAKKPPEREQATICLSVDMKEILQQEADRRGYAVKDLIMFILWSYFENTSQG